MLEKDFSFFDSGSLQSLNRLLVIAPYHDDESIGAGCFIADYNKRGGESYVKSVYSGESGIPDTDFKNAQKIRKQELSQAAKLLGTVHNYGLTFADRCTAYQFDITKALIPLMRKIKPGIVIILHMKERDPEHVITVKVTREAVWLSTTKIFPELGRSCPPIKPLFWLRSVDPD